MATKNIVIIGASSGLGKSITARFAKKGWKIGIAAREDIETLLGSKVNLRLFVKVKLDWRNNISQLNDLGYKDE